MVCHDPAGGQEICDGLDNNCDGAVDEGFQWNGLLLGAPCDGEGACGLGVVECRADGSGATCSTMPEGSAPESEPEICDGQDNDCDGNVDEALPAPPPGACEEKGVCALGEPTCLGDAGWACHLDAIPDFEAGEEKTCDGLDNDCDGETDEALPDLSCGVGACAQVTPSCVDGVVQTCTPLEPEPSESCDGLDNDCDGQTDEDLPELTCGQGACANQVASCIGGVPQVCTPLDPAPSEICDGLDNDCNGQTDEAIPALTCGEGVCENTVAACEEGVVQACVPLDVAEVEICGDDLDNDCDGQVDNGCCDMSCVAPFVCTPEGTCEDGADPPYVFIPDGSFMMGCPSGGACSLLGFKSASPEHLVTVDAFKIGKREVTAGEYALCVADGVCESPAPPGAGTCPQADLAKATWGDPNLVDLPMNFVTRTDATIYCAWAGGRLCTEAEWERAARGDDSRLYPWGDTEPTCAHANYSACGGELLPVAALPDGASPYGVLGLAGNVFEWVSDYYDPNYYDLGVTDNPKGPVNGIYVTARGGGFASSALNVRTYPRKNYILDYNCHWLGFRCCADL